ncbi:MAG: hypothetical protein V5A68_00620 [Candidatus Thermoplasmatota archaeon]
MTEIKDNEKKESLAEKLNISFLKKNKKTENKSGRLFGLSLFSDKEQKTAAMKDENLADWHVNTSEKVDDILSKHQMDKQEEPVSLMTDNLTEFIEARDPFDRKPERPEFKTEKIELEQTNNTFSELVQPIKTKQVSETDVQQLNNVANSSILHKEEKKDETKKQAREKRYPNKDTSSKDKKKDKKTFGSLFKKKRQEKESKDKKAGKKQEKTDKETTTMDDVELDEDIIKVLRITDDLLGKLPDETISEFANSDDFKIYEKVFEKYDIKKNDDS